MTPEIAVFGGAALITCFCFTIGVERVARIVQLIDVPNERSSHSIPTPRGGGLAIVVASIAFMAVLLAAGDVSVRQVVALVGGGGAVAGIGFADDRRHVSPALRLLVHFLAAFWAIFWIGPVPLILGTHQSASAVALDIVLSGIGVVWFVNVFNFMDGIDGIAASEAIFVSAAIFLFAFRSVHAASIALIAFGVCAATGGFLPRNWPRARIFMGDVGSGFLGYVIGVLALAYGADRPPAIWDCLILVGVFAVDSTVTLIRRAARGERLAVAHRSHAYQLLAKNFGHGAVTAGVILIDVCWLLPCAYLGALHPEYTPWIAIGALSPLAIATLSIGAGSSR